MAARVLHDEERNEVEVALSISPEKVCFIIMKAREQAAAAHNPSTASYFLGMPMLGDLLEEGLSMVGRSYEEFELGHL